MAEGDLVRSCKDDHSLSLNNESFPEQTDEVPSPIHRDTPSDSFPQTPYDPVDRTRVDYIPMSRTHFTRESPSVEVSPRTYALSNSARSNSLFKANTFNLANVSTGSVQSLPSQALSHIVEQRKSTLRAEPQEGKSHYYGDLASPIYERTQRWRNNSTSRLETIKAQNSALEVAECSFAPSLAPKTVAYWNSSDSVSVRTYKWQQDAERRQLQAKVSTRQARLEEETHSECPFRPTLMRGDQNGRKEQFDGKKFYARTVAWQREVQIKAQSPKAEQPSEPVTRVRKVFVQPKDTKKPEIHSELEDFKRHAASLSKLLQQDCPPSASVPKRVAVSTPSVKLKTRETSKADLRQALLQAKISFLESQVSSVLRGSLLP